MKRSIFFWTAVVGLVLGWEGSPLWAEQSGPAGAPGPMPSAQPSHPAQAKLSDPPAQAELPAPSASAQEQPPSPSASGLSALPSRQAEGAILKALAEKSEAEFVDMPFKEVLEYWRKRHKIPVVLDRKALETAGIGADQPVTLHIPEASFRGILEQVLEELGLSWTIRHESLWITTPEVANQCLVSRVYVVEDLLSGRSGDLKTELEELSDVIRSAVAPTSWAEAGGGASIAPWIVQGKGCLVVQQSWSIHWELMHLLEELREVARAKPSAPTPSEPKPAAVLPHPDQ